MYQQEIVPFVSRLDFEQAQKTSWRFFGQDVPISKEMCVVRLKHRDNLEYDVEGLHAVNAGGV